MTAQGHSSDNSKPQTLSQSIIDTMMSSGFLLVLTLVTGILLSRLLGPEGRGQYGSAIFWANFGVQFLGLAVFDATMIKIRGSEKNASSFLPSLISLSAALLVIAIVVGAICVWSGLIKVEGISSSVLLAMFAANAALSMGHKSISVVERANLRFRLVNIERVATPLLFLLSASMLFWLDESALPILLLLFVASKVPLYIFRLVRFRRQLFGKLDFTFLRESLKLALRMSFARQAITLAGQADRLVLVPLWSAQMLGYYFVAMSTCGAGLSLASQAIQMTLLPTLSGLEKEDKRNKVEQLIRLSTILAFGVVAGIWITAPYLVPLVFGADFEPAVPYVQGLVFASALKPIIAILNIANLSEEKTMPGVYIAISFVLVFGIGFLLLGFDDPRNFFIAFGLANLASVITGMVILARSGLVRFGKHIIAGPADVVFLFSTFWGYGKSMIRRKAK